MTMNKKNIIKPAIITIIVLTLIWFLFLRTKELTITYDGVENANTYGYTTMGTSAPMFRAAAKNETFMAKDMGVANAISADALYEESSNDEEAMTTPERYRENKFYRVDTIHFSTLVEDLMKVVKDVNGTIKINQQNSLKKVVYDNEFYPRYQELEFTVDNSVTDLSKIEETLGKWGEIRVSNSNITSIEQELTNYEQQLKEMEEARKALQESKDKDWIARQDSELAKKSERIKNQIENAKKQSTYKTYTVNIYEVIKFRVNAFRYWYENNYELKNAVSNVLPYMVKIFAILVPVMVMLILLVYILNSIIRGGNKRAFKDKLEAIKEEFNDKEVHFDIKM